MTSNSLVFSHVMGAIMCVGNWAVKTLWEEQPHLSVHVGEGFMEKLQEMIGNPSARQVRHDGKLAGMLVGVGCKVPVGRMGAGHGKCGCPVGKFELFSW